ncbi:MAG: UDP-2,3-diacylglucosamine diphosphatase [Bacteroidales bacterium]|nr:UDP-2,3-diacylglucosamine diphosphatase [Bacteroidales bacterium]
MPKHLTYFVSDIHLGSPAGDPEQRERRFVKFLKGIDPAETSALYLLGDIFDFWYEYRFVVPRGYARTLGALTDLVDAGVKVYFFEGNHDIWTFSYLQELGLAKLAQPYVMDIGNKRFCLGHGDGLGPGNHWYKSVKYVFSRHWAQVLFSTLHPWIAFKWATGWSQRSRNEKPIAYHFKGEDEPLYKFCKDFQDHNPVNYFIFGHYHSRVDMPVGTARLLLLGDWMTAPNWMVFDQTTGQLDICG